MDKIYDTAIVGSGIAGYSAALTAKNLRLDYIWFGEEELAEKLRLAEKVNNFPTVTGTGADFAACIEKQREGEGVVRTVRRIDGIFLTGECYALSAADEMFYAKTVILATGVELRGQLIGEREFLGRGVSYCAVCDGALYRGKRIAAVLSSPKFEEEAEYLAKFAREVVCVCLYQNPTLKGENLTVTQKIPRAVEGGSRVERIVFDDETMPVDGVFFLRDSAPASALAHGVEMDGAHVKVGRDMSTNLPGLFAAGDITGRPYQYVKAAGEGCVAAHSARAYLQEAKKR